MTRRIGDLGEFGLIERIARLADASGPRARGVVLGIGDDAAILRPRAGEDVVVSTDAAVEGVHFRWDTDAPRSLGRRALGAALSDLAAMGARPLGCTLALAAPPDLALRRLDPVLGGLVSEASARGCPLVGGNITRAGETSLALTVLGASARGRALRRTGARRGDALCVTGVLGRAALARARAEASGRLNRDVPPDRLAVGQRLARSGMRSACVDLSDGLAADLPHLLGPLGAEVDLSAIPSAPGLRASCERLGLDAEAMLVAGGEDYELLFSVPSTEADAAALSRRFGAPVSVVGRVVAQPGLSGLPAGGWRHF